MIRIIYGDNATGKSHTAAKLNKENYDIKTPADIIYDSEGVILPSKIDRLIKEFVDFVDLEIATYNKTDKKMLKPQIKKIKEIFFGDAKIKWIDYLGNIKNYKQQVNISPLSWYLEGNQKPWSKNVKSSMEKDDIKLILRWCTIEKIKIEFQKLNLITEFAQINITIEKNQELSDALKASPEFEIISGISYAMLKKINPTIFIDSFLIKTDFETFKDNLVSSVLCGVYEKHKDRIDSILSEIKLENIVYNNELKHIEDMIEMNNFFSNIKITRHHNYIEINGNNKLSSGQKTIIWIYKMLMNTKKILVLDDVLETLDKNNFTSVVMYMDSLKEVEVILFTHNLIEIEGIDIEMLDLNQAHNIQPKLSAGSPLTHKSAWGVINDLPAKAGKGRLAYHIVYVTYTVFGRDLYKIDKIISAKNKHILKNIDFIGHEMFSNSSSILHNGKINEQILTVIKPSMEIFGNNIPKTSIEFIDSMISLINKTNGNIRGINQKHLLSFWKAAQSRISFEMSGKQIPQKINSKIHELDFGITKYG